MSITDIKSKLPDYAKDTKLNLSAVMESEHLSPIQVHATALASAYAIGNKELLQAVYNEAQEQLDDAYLNAAKAAASIMGMNNIYYRFVHLVGQDYGKMPPRLRMNILANHGIDKIDFELFSLAVSAINGCGMCMESHNHHVVKGGISAEGIQDAIRIAAVLNATASTLHAEEMLG